MKCQHCGSTSGFRGEQKTEERKRSDGLIEMMNDGPERVYCKKCGTEVDPDSADEDGPVEVISGVPSRLQRQFASGDDPERIADEMLAAHGAPAATPEERQKLIDDIRASRSGNRQ
jgi:hypothetical protein